MSHDSNAEKIAAFLAEPVPGSSSSPGPQRDWWLDWHRRCAELGPEAPIAFIRALAEGNQNAQYGALLGLRHYGYEAWAEGYGDDEVYRIRRTGETEWTHIVPKIKQSDDPGVVVTGVKP
jgi:hypothetical protein